MCYVGASRVSTSKEFFYESLIYLLSRRIVLRVRLVLSVDLRRTARQEHPFAHSGDRWRAPALPDSGSRADGYSAARFRANFAHVGTDHPLASRTIHRDRAEPARHRRLRYSSER